MSRNGARGTICRRFAAFAVNASSSNRAMSPSHDRCGCSSASASLCRTAGRWPLRRRRQRHRARGRWSNDAEVGARSLGSAYALHPAFGEAAILDMGAGVRPAFPDNVPRIIVEDERQYDPRQRCLPPRIPLAPILAQAVAKFLSNGRREGPLFDAARSLTPTSPQPFASRVRTLRRNRACPNRAAGFFRQREYRREPSTRSRPCAARIAEKASRVQRGVGREQRQTFALACVRKRDDDRDEVRPKLGGQRFDCR